MFTQCTQHPCTLQFFSTWKQERSQLIMENKVTYMSWIWLPLTTTAHHPWLHFPSSLHSHMPVHHYPITQLSPFTHHSDCLHHTCTSFTHSHKSSTQTLTQCEVLFPPGYISERISQFVFPCTTWTVDLLSWSFAACLSDLACFMVILSVCRLPWPIALSLFRLCLFYVALDTSAWYLPVFDLVLIKLLVDLLSPLTCHLFRRLRRRWIQQ